MFRELFLVCRTPSVIAGERNETEGVLSFKRGAQCGLPAFTRGKAGSGCTLAPRLRVGLSGGQAVPRLDAHKPHRLCGSRPDERIGVAFHIAGDLSAGVLLTDADGAGAQACHAEAVVCKQIIGQRDGLLVLPLVIASAAQQTVGPGSPAGQSGTRSLW